MHLSRVGVVGAGTMGHGIAQVFAQAGFYVVLVDQTVALAESGFAKIKANLKRSVEKGKLSDADAQTIAKRINTTEQLNSLADVHLVVEAVQELFETKQHLFTQLDGICGAETIFASNTSSLPITKLAACTKRPAQFVGMHFMNPVPIMKLVEVIRGHLTSQQTVETILDLCGKLGKTAAESEDYPGFIANRILMPMINEAIFALMEGVGTRESIDSVMKLGMNHPMGPLELADFIGLDVCLAILEVLYEGFKDPKYRPCPLLQKMVDAKLLGRKTGHGFYNY